MGRGERRPRPPRDHPGAARPPRHVRRDPAAAVQRLRRHDRAVHAQRGLQHDVRPRHHRDHDRASSRRASIPATEPVTTIRYEVPAGIVAANAATRAARRRRRGRCAASASPTCPRTSPRSRWPSGPTASQLHGAAAQYGALSVDLAFGGAYYGIVNAAELGLRVVPEQADALRRAGAAITDVLRRDHTPAHPTDPDLGFVYGTIIVDLRPAHVARRPRRRRPHAQRDDLRRRRARPLAVRLGHERDPRPAPRARPDQGRPGDRQRRHHRRALPRPQSRPRRHSARTAAVSTSIAGTAYVTGYSTFIVDSRDPLGEGFLLS